MTRFKRPFSAGSVYSADGLAMPTTTANTCTTEMNRQRMKLSRSGLVGVGGIILFAATVVGAGVLRSQPDLDVPEVEGSFHGFPILRDLHGGKLADGEFLQWIEKELLRIKNTYDFGDDHRVEETVIFRLPSLIQEEWSWREFIAGALQREYSVDLKSGQARAQKREKNETKHWTEKLKIESGRTYAGVGFTVAIKSLRARLMRGETIELRAVGFTPKPRLVTVKISHAGLDRMAMSGRTVLGDRFLIQAKIPAIAKIIIEAPDTRIWLTHPAPAGFLRWEGALAEPSDPVVRVDLLPGDPSGLAEPVGESAPAPR
jgi:hypothetical protein